MKKVLMIILLASFIASLALNVQAANVIFDPGKIEFNVAPGETETANITVRGYSNMPYSLYFRLAPRLGTVPPGWVRPVYLKLASGRGGPSTSPMNININIPPGTVAGSYTAVLAPQNLNSSEPINSPGIILAIKVTESFPECTGIPIFSDVKISPENIWAPAGRDVEIEISGVVSAAVGCGELTADYSLESDNGIVQGDIVLDAEGNFAERIWLKVSKDGKDKDGSTYNGRIVAIDSEYNEAELGFSVTVLHDRGKKTEQAK